MAEVTYSEIFKNGLWTNNGGLVQLLGLCPLLAVTSSTVNGLGLGIATILTLVISNITIALIRNLVRPEVRIPVFVLVIASVVTVIDLMLNAFFHELHGILGIFIPLIVTNCIILGRAEAFASKSEILPSAADGLAMGTGFAAVLVTLGAMREILGQGTFMAQAHLLFGDFGNLLEVTVIEDYPGFLLAILPPGAFLGLGFLLALKNIIDSRLEKRAASKPVATSDTDAPAAIAAE